jgi:hypothetical protein
LLHRSLALLAVTSLLTACDGGTGTDPGTTPPRPLQIPDDPDCDPLVPEVCAMPLPSSRWLVPDKTRVTGYTLSFGKTTLPRNSMGVHVDPAPYTRLDGFGVGAPAVTFFPDLDGSDLPDETRIAESLTDTARVMMFAVKKGALVRIPCFGEIDKAAKDEEQASLFIRPAVLLEEATRYVVALRGLKRKDGSPVPPSDAFTALRDKRAEGTPVEGRTTLYEELFAMLEAAGVHRGDLQLTWDWTTASGDTLHGPLLHMRDEAFAELGDKSPEITITSTETYTEAENASIAYEVQGTFAVPDYTVKAPVGTKQGYFLNWGPDGLPAKSGVYQAEFRARVPRSAKSGEPHGVLVHGHGLNGTHGQIRAGFFDELAQKEKLIIVGCNMIGMSSEDVNTTLEILNDMSGFPALADRLHQGVLDHAFLARAMKRGFDKVPEIAATGLVIDPESIYYNGISQGGIFGATHLAMSLDIKRGQLGVPGNNYSTLLQRSSDFGPFFVLLGFVYPDARDQVVLLSAIQNLWDRTDPVSHYRHVSAEPYPGTPAHEVLLGQAQGDWQVAPLTNEIAVRSDIGVALLPHYGKEVALVKEVAYPHTGSGLVSYSFGNPWPPPGNVPPFDDVGDPHGKPRELAWYNQQMMHFFRTGEIIDVCGGDGCTPQ